MPTTYRADFAGISELEALYFKMSTRLLGSSEKLIDDLLNVVDELKRSSNEAPEAQQKQVPVSLLDVVRYQFAMAMLACLRGHASTSLVFARGMAEACGHACCLVEDPTLVEMWSEHSRRDKPDKRSEEHTSELQSL